jgi:glycosyltransferase involved in cell wall biosynthesis
VRILVLSHYYPPEVNAPAQRTYEHCVRWAKAGHDVTVITCAPNCPGGVVFAGFKNRFRRQVEQSDGVRVIRVWTYLAPNAGTVRRVVNFLSYLVSAVLATLRLPRPDVVVATSPQFFCGWAGVIVSRLKRAPFVLEIRDIWPESIETVGAIRNRPLLRCLEWLERRMYLAARHIVTVGEGYRAKILAKADVHDRISVITNGVDLRFFVPAQPDPRFLHMWDLEGKFVCSYVGTIGMAHGLNVVLEAARILQAKGRRDIAFCLVGDGALRKQLEQQSARDNLRGLVVFTGMQPKEEIPAILASSDACLIHLRKSDLFTTVMPSKIFETMAMARPIIMGVCGEARDIVMDAGAGIAMEPDSATSLVEAVETLADDREFASRQGRAARDYVAARFNRELLAARFLELLESIAGSVDEDRGVPPQHPAADKSQTRASDGCASRPAPPLSGADNTH